MPSARRLYRAFGFAEVAEEPLVADGWVTASRAWVLMLKARLTNRERSARTAPFKSARRATLRRGGF